MTQLTLPAGMEIIGDIKPGYERVLTPDALALVAKLSRAFDGRRGVAARGAGFDSGCSRRQGAGADRRKLSPRDRRAEGFGVRRQGRSDRAPDAVGARRVWGGGRPDRVANAAKRAGARHGPGRKAEHSVDRPQPVRPYRQLIGEEGSLDRHDEAVFGPRQGGATGGLSTSVLGLNPHWWTSHQ